jgi:hypothetical protein
MKNVRAKKTRGKVAKSLVGGITAILTSEAIAKVAAVKQEGERQVSFDALIALDQSLDENLQNGLGLEGEPTDSYVDTGTSILREGETDAGVSFDNTGLVVFAAKQEEAIEAVASQSGIETFEVKQNSEQILLADAAPVLHGKTLTDASNLAPESDASSLSSTLPDLVTSLPFEVPTWALVAGTAAVAVAAAGGGGGGGGSVAGATSSTNTTSTSTNGSLADGYIWGATVFRDMDGDGVLDSGEYSVTTDQFGHFIGLGGSGGTIVAYGGVDVSTGKAFEGVLQAPAGASVINPITTLVVAALGDTSGMSDSQIAAAKTAAEAKIATILGIDSSLGALSDLDPLALVAAGGQNAALALSAQLAAIQAANVLVTITSAIQSAGLASGLQDASKLLTEALGQTIRGLTNSGSLDFSEAALINNIFNAVADVVDNPSTASLTAFQAASQTAANAIAVVNNVIGDLDLSGGLTSLGQAVAAQLVIVDPSAGLLKDLQVAILTSKETIQNTLDQNPNADLEVIINAGVSLNGYTDGDIQNLITDKFDQVGDLTGAGLPTASVEISDTQLKAGETAVVTITFSEAVTGFTNEDVNVENGVLSTFVSADGGVTWTAVYTPSLVVQDSSNVISIEMAGLADLQGNSGKGVVTSEQYVVDTKYPEYSSGNTSSVSENVAAGTVVYTAAATDSGDGTDGAVTYSLKAAGDADSFTINASTGAVSIKASPDYETKASYGFMVVATDAAGNVSEQAVTLSVSNSLDYGALTAADSALDGTADGTVMLNTSLAGLAGLGIDRIAAGAGSDVGTVEVAGVGTLDDLTGDFSFASALDVGLSLTAADSALDGTADGTVMLNTSLAGLAGLGIDRIAAGAGSDVGTVEVAGVGTLDDLTGDFSFASALDVGLSLTAADSALDGTADGTVMLNTSLAGLAGLGIDHVSGADGLHVVLGALGSTDWDLSALNAFAFDSSLDVTLAATADEFAQLDLVALRNAGVDHLDIVGSGNDSGSVTINLNDTISLLDLAIGFAGNDQVTLSISDGTSLASHDVSLKDLADLGIDSVHTQGAISYTVSAFDENENQANLSDLSELLARFETHGVFENDDPVTLSVGTSIYDAIVSDEGGEIQEATPREVVTELLGMGIDYLTTESPRLY